MNRSEQNWAVEEHFDGVLRRGRQLRRRHLSLLGGTAGVAMVLVVLALGLQTHPRADQELRTAGGAPMAPAIPGTASPLNIGSPTTTISPDTTIPSEVPLSVAPAAVEGSPTTSGTAVATPGPTAVAEQVSPVPSSPSTTKPSPPSTAAPSRDPVTVNITESDGNTSISLRPGDRLVVQLSGQLADYDEPVSSNEGVLRRSGGSTGPDGSASASFAAVADGQSGVRYSASPKCRRATPMCMVSTQGYTISVLVVG